MILYWKSDQFLCEIHSQETQKTQAVITLTDFWVLSLLLSIVKASMPKQKC